MASTTSVSGGSTIPTIYGGNDDPTNLNFTTAGGDNLTAQNYRERIVFSHAALVRKNLEAKQIPRMDAASEARLAKVNPQLANRIRLMAAELRKQGIRIMAVSGLRTFAEQNALYAQGRTKPGNIVTNARGGQSLHNYGLAVDVVPVNSNGQPNWNASEATWQKIGTAGKKLGMEWGGNWTSFKDRPHFQMTGGKSISTLLSEYRANNGNLGKIWDGVNKKYPHIDGATDATTPTNANGIKIKNLPNYSQADRRWGSEPYKLNPSLGSFAGNGCTVTAAAIAASWASGKTVTPHDANANFGATIAKFEYQNIGPGGKIPFGNTFGAIDKDSSAARNLIAKVKNSIKSGHPVVLGIYGGVSNPDGNHWSRHTVVATGIDKNGDLLVNDPATGKTQPLSAFKFNNFDMAQKISRHGGKGGEVVGNAPVDSPNSTNPATSNLSIGARGEAVEKLQRDLTKLGYKLAADGIFGSKTDQAVRHFQRDRHLEVDGIVGPKTRAAIARAKKHLSTPVPTAFLQHGSRGEQVKQLQNALVKLKFMTQAQMNTGPGIFGPRTEAALRHFQRNRGLVADGIYGPKSQAALRKALGGANTAPTNPTTPTTPSNPPSAASGAKINAILKGTNLAGKGDLIAKLAKQYRIPAELALAMFRKEAGFASNGSLAQRNNNPGNIRFVGQAGATRGAGGFARWSSMDKGIEAYFKLLDRGYRSFIDRKDWHGLVNKYAPPVENDSDLYARQIIQWMKEYRSRI